jgi:hypothetical protein
MTIRRHLSLLFGALLWFGAVVWLATRGVFVSARNEIPIVLALAFMTPILLFFAAVRLFSQLAHGGPLDSARISDRAEWLAIHRSRIRNGVCGGSFARRVRLARGIGRHRDGGDRAVDRCARRYG